MLEDIQKKLDKIMADKNSRGLPQFEGYSPHQMHFILYDPWNGESPLRLQRLAEADYNSIPILNLVRHLGGIIAEEQELKLTAKGFLPVKVVADLYAQGFIKERYIESGLLKLYKEENSKSISLTRILIEISGIAKKRNNKLSITKTGKDALSDNFKLLQLLLETFSTKFNWAYFDGYGDHKVGQVGWAFSLILLGKYGADVRMDEFYAAKYFTAFPTLKNSFTARPYSSVDEQSVGCYSLRTFEVFLDYFGLIQSREIKKRDDDVLVSKSDLFEKLIRIQ